jgi:hypothetical protein
VFGAGAGDGRGGPAIGYGQQPVLPLVAPQQQMDAGGAGHRAEHLGHARVQPSDACLRAERLGRGQDAEEVDRPGRDGRAVTGGITALGVALRGGLRGVPSHGRVGPVDLVDLGGCAPCEVVVAGVREKVVADVLDAVGEEEPGRAFGNQRPMPRPLTPGHLAPCGVEGDHGGAEVTGRPGPLGLDQPQQVKEVVRRTRGPSGQPPRQFIQLGEQIVARVTVRRTGLVGKGQAAQQADLGGGVEAVDGREQFHRRGAVLGEPGRITKDGGGVGSAEMRIDQRRRVVGVPLEGDRLARRRGVFAAQHADEPLVAVEPPAGLLVTGSAQEGEPAVDLGEEACQ